MNNIIEINNEGKHAYNIVFSVPTLLILALMIILFSFLVSGLTIAMASKSKTFKEAQSSLTPITFISFFPGMISFMINIKTSLIISIIPFLNFIILVLICVKVI